MVKRFLLKISIAFGARKDTMHGFHRHMEMYLTVLYKVDRIMVRACSSVELPSKDPWQSEKFIPVTAAFTFLLMEWKWDCLIMKCSFTRKSRADVRKEELDEDQARARLLRVINNILSVVAGKVDKRANFKLISWQITATTWKCVSADGTCAVSPYGLRAFGQ